MRLHLTVFLILLSLPILLVASDSRAQSWKPVNRMGARELSLIEINYLILPQVESQRLASAVDDLQRLFTERYDKTLQLVDAAKLKQAIYFETADVGEGGAFSISRERTRIIIRGTDAEAWVNAIYAICSDMLGARWYWSGELGFEWVDPPIRYFPSRPWVERPAFVQRRLHPVETDFARRNRLNEVYSFNHNLARIFTGELFIEKPEVFAEINGRRKAPDGNAARDPQPDFSNPLTVEIAAQAALEYFEENPTRTSYSLSINDNVLFDTTEDTEKLVSPLRYYRGRPNYTDLVFGFMNQVAERVFNQADVWETPSGEPRYLTALAYYWTEPAPSMPLHPRVMPVLTSDRAQWHDPDYRAQDKKLIEQWVQSGAERVATWDYYFGAPYIYPRQFNQWIDESLKYLADSGVDVLFSQLPSFWGLDGAKAWLAAELLWNPEQDAEGLLEEYYQNFFGSAAGSMRAFYEMAERHRNTHEGEADWIKLYKDESSISLFTEDVLSEMRGYVVQAEGEVANDGRRLARVQVISEAFRLTELYEAYNRIRQELVWMVLLKPGQKIAIQDQLAAFKNARSSYRKYLDTYLSESAYAPARRRVDLGQSNPEMMASAAISEVGKRSFASILKDPRLQHLGFEQRNFLSPEIPRLADWHVDYRPSEGFALLPSEHTSGRSGLRIVNADIVSIFGVFPAIPNREYALQMKADWKSELDNRVYIHIDWLDREGAQLGSFVPIRFPIGASEESLDIHLPMASPDNAHDVRIRIVVSRQYPEDFLDISELDFRVVW